MKKCPACGTQYSDDTLLYCLQDGTSLESVFIAETPTVVLDEVETAPRAARVNTPSPAGERRSSVPIAVVVTAFAMLLLFGIAGLAAWMFLKSKQPEPVPNIATSNTDQRTTPASNAKPSPNAARTATTPSAATPGTETAIDEKQVSDEVSQRIMSWSSKAESFDLSSYMAHYDDTVDYYTRPGASAAYVRSDKQRAFSRYTSMNINITNVSVTADPSGRTATAVFDKEWEFAGNGTSAGKVRQMMRFRKANGQWLITAEKDLKLYYKR